MLAFLNVHKRVCQEVDITDSQRNNVLCTSKGYGFNCSAQRSICFLPSLARSLVRLLARSLVRSFVRSLGKNLT